jgi:phosphoribosylaminoimidazolecarboxamide formyltransferase/IMP cyclohydrolase
MSDLSTNTGGNALLSVYDKAGIEPFAEGLVELDWNVYASGGTKKKIEDAGIPVTDVAELVGGAAILGHRVVTLSREISAGVLANLDDESDVAELTALGIPPINLVCVDPYPLEAAIAEPGATHKSIINQTDIGGPTLLREAAKGGRIVLSVAEQRQAVLEWLRAGRPDETAFLYNLAARATYEVARYTAIEAAYYNGNDVSIFIGYKKAPTKYGENPQQTPAGLYADTRINIDPLSIDQFKHVKGWEQSFINTTDMDSLLQTATHIAAGFERNFANVPPMAIGVKHGNPCGAGVAETSVEAVKKMLEGDTRAIFGGVIMINGTIDKDVAEALMHHAMDSDANRLLDGVVGAAVTEEALEILSRNKLRVVVNPALATLTEASIDQSRRMRPVRGAMLEQPNYIFVQDLSAEHMAIHGELTTQQREDLILAWAIGSTSNSNTITIVKDGKLIGNGVGQQDRVGAAQLALMRTTTETPLIHASKEFVTIVTTLDRAKLEGSVAYSDSFFPFSDGPLLLAETGIKAILTSSGSVADESVIASLRGAGVSVAMVPDKVGRGFAKH